MYGRRSDAGQGWSGILPVGSSRIGQAGQACRRNTGVGCAQKPQKRLSAGRGQSGSAGSPLGGRMDAGRGSRPAAPTRRHGCAPEPYTFCCGNGRCEALESDSDIKPPGSLRSTAVVTTQKLPQRGQICPLKDFKSCKMPFRRPARARSAEKCSRQEQKCWVWAVMPSILFHLWATPPCFLQGCP